MELCHFRSLHGLQTLLTRLQRGCVKGWLTLIRMLKNIKISTSALSTGSTSYSPFAHSCPSTMTSHKDVDDVSLDSYRSFQTGVEREQNSLAKERLARSYQVHLLNTLGHHGTIYIRTWPVFSGWGFVSRGACDGIPDRFKPARKCRYRVDSGPCCFEGGKKLGCCRGSFLLEPRPSYRIKLARTPFHYQEKLWTFVLSQKV